jgi:hypothetical protein
MERDVTSDDRTPRATSVTQGIRRISETALDVALALVLGIAVTIAIAVSPQQGAPPNLLTYSLGWTIAALVLFRRR